MPQLNYDAPSRRAGTLQRLDRAASLTNTRTVQVDNIDIDGTTTDGTYLWELYDPTGVQLLASTSYVASSKTAAQIAAGSVAAILADPDWRGFITACAVVNTDQLNITYKLHPYGLDLVLRAGSGTPNGPDITTSTSAGLTRIGVGRIIQSSGSGAWTTTYTDASLAIGVTYYSSAVAQPDDLSLAPSIGDATFGLLAAGTLDVAVASGVTVYQGDKVYYNPTNATWSNSASGSHTLVEGAQWQTSGTTVQTVYVNLPSET